MSCKITGFCCNYTIDVDTNTLKQNGYIDEYTKIIKVPCTGRIEVNQLLDAFTEGANAVFVAGCKEDTCHNLKGSKNAEKRVSYAKEILKELDMDPELIEMFYVPRLETEPVLTVIKEMKRRVENKN